MVMKPIDEILSTFEKCIDNDLPMPEPLINDLNKQASVMNLDESAYYFLLIRDMLIWNRGKYILYSRLN